VADLRVRQLDVAKNPKCQTKVVEAMVITLAIGFLERDGKIVKEVLDRLEGRLPLPIQGVDGAPALEIRVTREDGSIVKW
jgi:hypothetical protein